jgi:hypothetical protein
MFTTIQKRSTDKYSTTVRYVISRDGKIMTSDVRGIGGDGNPVTYTMVYERQ